MPSGISKVLAQVLVQQYYFILLLVETMNVFEKNNDVNDD